MGGREKKMGVKVREIESERELAGTGGRTVRVVTILPVVWS